MFKSVLPFLHAKRKGLVDNLKTLALAGLFYGLPRLMLAQSTGNKLTWGDALNASDPLTQFMHTGVLALMGVFLLVGVVLVVLAFKGLNADQQLAPFWLKLIGGCGALVAPPVYYWLSTHADTMTNNGNSSN